MPNLASTARRTWMERIARFAVRHGAQRRAIFMLSGISMGDYFIPALPNQTSVIALGMLQPRRAAWIALAFSGAAGIGAAIFCLLLLSMQDYARQFGSDQFGADWEVVMARAEAMGAWAVLVASISPIRPRILIAATILSGGSAPLVIGAASLGKLVWFSLFLAVLIKAPHLLKRVPFLGTGLKRFESFKESVLATSSPADSRQGFGRSR